MKQKITKISIENKPGVELTAWVWRGKELSSYAVSEKRALWVQTICLLKGMDTGTEITFTVKPDREQSA